jgi:hypothetical protein
LHSTFSHEPNVKIVIIENVCLIHMPFFFFKVQCPLLQQEGPKPHNQLQW